MVIVWLCGGVAFILFGVGLVLCVTGLVRGNRESVVATAPLIQEQEIRLPPSTGGEILVLVETPRTAADYGGFQIQFVEKQTGQVVTLGYSMMRAQGTVYGVTTMKVPFGRLPARPGVYTVRISGMQPGADYSRYGLILSKPYMGRMALQIIGIVLCGVGMLLTAIGVAWSAGLLKFQNQ